MIRQGRRGGGLCILVEPDVDTYEDMIDLLLTKNVSLLAYTREAGIAQW